MTNKYRKLSLCDGSSVRHTVDYLIAMLPIYFWSIFAFGAPGTHFVLAVSFSATVILSLCMQFAVLRRIDYRKLLTAVVVGFTLGFLMPPAAPMWLVVLGAFIATVPFYLPYVGSYFTQYIHPIALALVLLSIFSKSMSAQTSSLLLENTAEVTPLVSLLNGSVPKDGVYDLLIGRHSGLMGEVSVLMILAGGLYLFARKLIKLHAPLAMLASIAVLSYLFPITDEQPLAFLVAQMFSGGIFFTAVYLLPFTPTCPITNPGRIIYGIMCGVLTFVIRRFYSGFDGVFIALLLSAAIIRFIDPFIQSKPIRWEREF